MIIIIIIRTNYDENDNNLYKDMVSILLTKS